MFSLRRNCSSYLFLLAELFPDLPVPHWEDRSLPDLCFVGNLPFNVSTPLLIRMLRDMEERKNLFSHGRVPLLLTFQHEVAYRLIAPPGDRERSRITIFAQNYAQVSQ
jgi:dimethyladenosine transferase 1